MIYDRIMKFQQGINNVNTFSKALVTHSLIDKEKKQNKIFFLQHTLSIISFGKVKID